MRQLKYIHQHERRSFVWVKNWGERTTTEWKNKKFWIEFDTGLVNGVVGLELQDFYVNSLGVMPRGCDFIGTKKR